MSDPPEKLIPAKRDDLIATLAFALTRDGCPARMQSAELLASIVAERIVDRLEASGYVVGDILVDKPTTRCRVESWQAS
jgi:hypothetical protein